jgi:TrmH family RNA methyltransferase
MLIGFPLSEKITSLNNSKIKLVRSLQNRQRQRQTEGFFLAEGVRLIEEAVSVHWPIEFILYDETLSERGKDLIATLNVESQVETLEIPSNLMAEISGTETPQGILAVLEQTPLALPQHPTFILIADQIRDPGNLGTILRTAEATGVDGVLLSPGTVDAFSPKVVRAGMGAHFRLPIHHTSWDELQAYLHALPVFLADSGAGLPIWEANLVQPCALLIGGEAFGASPSGEEIATQKVTIPMQGRMESLNAAAAAAILMAEVLRQRYTGHKE